MIPYNHQHQRSRQTKVGVSRQNFLTSLASVLDDINVLVPSGPNGPSLKDTIRNSALLSAPFVQQPTISNAMGSSEAMVSRNQTLLMLLENQQSQQRASLLAQALAQERQTTAALQQQSYLALLRQHQVSQQLLKRNSNTVQQQDGRFNEVVRKLGGENRIGKQYVDVAALTILNMSPKSSIAYKTNRGGVAETFPEKLHRMLQEIDTNFKDYAGVVSFCSHGRAFIVHDVPRFCTCLLPKYFQRQTKWKSFVRQLNLYGFTRISNGPDAGGYFHELFLRGRPNLCRYMKRVGVPTKPERQKEQPPKKLAAEETPNFYSMAIL